MHSFINDYSESAHPRILEAMGKAGLEQNDGYGLDGHCDNAVKLIRKQLGNDTAEIHFLPGGTITNLTFISHALRPYEAVIAADKGHINVHETGAIEATGHKVVDIPALDGKLTPEIIEPVLRQHEDEHWVKPAMVYLSNPTELGTVYDKKELLELRDYCKKNALLLYLDGARLPMALAVKEAGLSLRDLAEQTDAFYIGGTKAGALFGEALVIIKDSLKESFRFNMKQNGAMLAKGWLLGMQFEELFRDGLYFRLGEHSNAMAKLLRQAFEEGGIAFASNSPTNQIFPILPNTLLEKLNRKYKTSLQGRVDAEHSIVRFCTSWATEEKDVLQFIGDFRQMRE